MLIYLSKSEKQRQSNNIITRSHERRTARRTDRYMSVNSIEN